MIYSVSGFYLIIQLEVRFKLILCHWQFSIILQQCQHRPLAYLRQILENRKSLFVPLKILSNWVYAIGLCRTEPLVSGLWRVTVQRSSLTKKKASGTPSAMDVIWSTFCASLWVDNFCFIGRCPIIFPQITITWRFRMTLFKESS